MEKCSGLRGKTKGTVVLVAQFFPPLNVIGAQRAARMARELLNVYDRVIVVTQNWDYYDPSLLDFNYESSLFDNPDLLVVEASALLKHYGPVKKPLLVQQIIGAILTRILCSTGLDWIPDLNRKLKSLTRQRNADEINLKMILATGAPFICFWPVTRWAKRNSIKVILDYRDLWTGNPRVPHSRFFRLIVNSLIERRVNNSATAILTVSEGCKTAIAADSPCTKKFILYNSPDPEYIKYYKSHIADNHLYKKDRQKKQVVFTGQVYKECTFAPFLRAFDAICKTKKEQIEVHYYGGNSTAVRREFRHFGLDNYLYDHGSVSKSESINAILEADLLLSFIHTDSVSVDSAVSGLLTTKVYDYFLSGKPILNIAPVDAEINKFAHLIEYDPFYTFVANDYTGIGDTLIGLLSMSGLKIQKPLSVKLPNFSDDFRSILNQLEK